MPTLTIRWRRLLDEAGATCPRCSDTGEAVARAAAKLQAALVALGVQVELETGAIDPVDFRRDPLQSNSIEIGGRSLEAWLGGATGSSPCCDACGDADCRTVTLDGVVFEAVPERLIIRAGLLAAAELYGCEFEAS